MARRQKIRIAEVGEPRELSALAVAAGSFADSSGEEHVDFQEIKQGRSRPSYMVETNLGGILEDIPGLNRARVMAGPFSGFGVEEEHKLPNPVHPRRTPRLELAFGEGCPWTRIWDATVPPWRAICHLEIQFTLNRATGTGWFVDQHTIITAGHNLLHPDLGWAKGILIRPGLNVGGHGLNKAIPAAAGDVHPAWKASNGRSPPHDIAYLKVRDPSIGRFVGTFGMRVMTDQELAFGNLIVHSAGYPSTKSAGSLWADASRIGGFSNELIFYRLDTETGNSGAPIFAAFPDGQRLVVACHTQGAEDRRSNSGVRITDDVFDLIASWIS